MKKISLLTLIVGALVVTLSFAGEAWADIKPKRPYQYVSLDVPLPLGFDFFQPQSINDKADVYGNLIKCDSDFCSFFVAVYRRGEITVLQEGIAAVANNRGTIGGGVVLDPAAGTTQAALFARGKVDLIPPLTDEVTSTVQLLTNSGIAFVESLDQNSNQTYYLTKGGDVTLLDFGPDPAFDFDINNRGVISGTSFRPDASRAFRYDPSSGSFTVLDPLPTEPESWGQAINSRGDVLGYSFVNGGLERIGVWRGAKFRTYFVEGTPEFPTISNQLEWNERGLIVVTRTDDQYSYLVPRPGVRLNLADLTEGPLPRWTEIFDINNKGDLLGFGGPRSPEVSNYFLLRHRGLAASVVAEFSSLSAAAAGADPVSNSAAVKRILQERLLAGTAKGGGQLGE